MNRKIAIKRLSASDLTFFEHHYRHTDGTKQKAFNLDRAVFIDVLYPSLPVAVGEGPVKVALSIRGPGMAPAQNLMRKILKQDKNWRLNGELIFDPPDTKNLYAALQKGDFAIIEFIGGVAPDSVMVQLVAQAQPEDLRLHTAIDSKYGNSFSAHKGMIVPDTDEFLGILVDVGLDPSHPASDLLETDFLEDVVLGGLHGFESLTRRREGRVLTKAEFQQSKENAERVGRLGEQFVNSHLADQKDKGVITEFEWTSDINPIAPYDFAIKASGAITTKIDVKSTGGKQDNPVHVSMAELVEMIHSTVPYKIYRVHGIKERSGVLAVSKDVREFAKAIGASIQGFPQGVVPDGFSIDPKLLNLGRPQTIGASDDNEEATD